jgi:adenosine deaminase
MEKNSLRIDTHRHLGGSIPTDFVWSVVQSCNLTDLADSYQDVLAAMTFKPGERRGFHRFLDKFKILDRIPWNQELIEASIEATCRKLQIERVDYCWMDFSINKYMQYLDMSMHDIILYIHQLFQKYRPNKVGLVISLKYESPRAHQKKYADLIHDPDVAKCLIGIDLVGDEEYFDADFYAPIFHQWRDAGKMVRAHVAESQGAENALDAITKMHVTNIAHGLKLIDHPHMVQIAKAHKVCFDLGISSNYLTGVWQDDDSHPVEKMLEFGLDVTIGTDDPIQCNTDLITEFAMVRHWFGVSQELCDQMIATATKNILKYEECLSF